MGMKMKVTKPEDLANGDDGSSWQDDLFKLSCIPPELLTDQEFNALLNKIKARKLHKLNEEVKRIFSTRMSLIVKGIYQTKLYWEKVNNGKTS